MSKFLLSVALGLAVLGGVAPMEPLGLQVASAAAQIPAGYTYFRSQPTRQEALFDAASNLKGRPYVVVQGSHGEWQIWSHP